MLEVELCGRLADGGDRFLRVAIPAAGCPAQDLLENVAANSPALAELLAAGRIKACVNDAIVAGDHRVAPGDVVALFPPVSGG
jgi:molybdopterin synthase sulfur carrier subunit